MPTPVTLWGDLQPIAVWVTVSLPAHPDDGDRAVTLRIRLPERRSITVTRFVSCYADEVSILRAMSECVLLLSRHLTPLTRTTVAEEFHLAIEKWVEPF